MTHVARRAAAVTIILAAGYAFYAFCVVPYQCNVLRKSLTHSTAEAFARRDTPEAAVVGRRNLAAISRCRVPTCRDLDTEMIAAANYRIIGRDADAAQLYRDALRFDRRPEIYYNLANTELAMGRREAAIADFVRASIFNPWLIRDINDGQARAEVLERLVRLRPEDREYLHYIDSVNLAD